LTRILPANFRPARARVAGLAILAAGLALAPCAGGFELYSVEAQHEGNVFEFHIEARFEAAPAQVLAVLTDYDRLHELHPRMTESRSLGEVDAATEEVYSRFEGCVLLFCRTLGRVERIGLQDGYLVAEDVPGRGSFREGRTVWRLSSDAGGSRLRYTTRFVPDFWVAPVVGARALARSVERMTVEMMEKLDSRAQRLDE
jgi:hypothetical protein